MNKTDWSLTLLNLRYWQGAGEGGEEKADNKPFLVVLHPMKKIKKNNKAKK